MKFMSTAKSDVGFKTSHKKKSNVTNNEIDLKHKRMPLFDVKDYIIYFYRDNKALKSTHCLFTLTSSKEKGICSFLSMISQVHN